MPTSTTVSESSSEEAYYLIPPPVGSAPYRSSPSDQCLQVQQMSNIIQDKVALPYYLWLMHHFEGHVVSDQLFVCTAILNLLSSQASAAADAVVSADPQSISVEDWRKQHLRSGDLVSVASSQSVPPPDSETQEVQEEPSRPAVGPR